ncbi:MAG: hypothetical protein PGN23_06800 [Sphingomonas adhaesiva]|uniref:hypothetical protein n=1 Tax=Sphingomonas adhaesiva TaxID=28212 RepID=UPI002FF64D10
MRNTPRIRVERLEEEYLPRRAKERQFRETMGVRAAESPALYDLPDGAAVVVPDAVHVYVRAISYDDVRVENGQETEASHKRALAFLNLLYVSGDRAVQAIGAQRVDFHGARMHAVVTEPTGQASLGARLSRALAIARDMTDLARAIDRTLPDGSRFPLRFRIGVDAGTCIAINSGRSDDREPVFIGPAANHAAKLADGDREGIYLSDRLRRMLGLQTAGSLDLERAQEVPAYLVAAAAERFRASGSAARLEEFLRDQRGGEVTPLSPSAFTFHRHTPPLSGIDYAALSPSRSVRMPLASVFADLDRYTAYVDHCMATGCLPDAVRLLHVLRSEFNAVLQRDFGGRKVRFIGDCIHGLLAVGTSFETDEQATIELATQCAGALRSSFELCQRIVEHADRLGLAIGFEYGWTPVTRIGIRGERSVRTASSLASRGSERCQRQCGGDETMIGEAAYDRAPVPVRKLFGPSRIASGLTYDDVATAGTPVAPKVAAAAAPAILSSPAAAAPLSRAYGC